MAKLIDNFVVITNEENDDFRLEVLPCVLPEYNLNLPDKNENYHLVVKGKEVIELKFFNQ